MPETGAKPNVPRLQRRLLRAIEAEVVPADLAQRVTKELRIPTIGIGAGAGCDGQVQVWHDLLNYATTVAPRHIPRHVKQYAHVGETMRTAIEQLRAGTI